MSPASPKDRHQIIIAREVMLRVDEWRRTQEDLPNKSEAIRRLLTIALAQPDARKVVREREDG